MLNSKIHIAIFWIILFCLLSALPVPWNDPVEDAIIDLQFKIRGSRNLSDDILFIHIGAEDIQALDGWPISRDYYGYLIHILQSAGAKTIGLDILFDKADPHYAEYDRTFLEFMRSARNVCLPMTFQELTLTSKQFEDMSKKIWKGMTPTYPFEPLKTHAAGLGFSNLGIDGHVRSIPLLVSENDSVRLSFGCELARIHLNCSKSFSVRQHDIVLTDAGHHEYTIPMEEHGEFRLNHFGSIENVKTTGLIDLFQTYENSRDSLQLRDKLILLAVTAPGLAVTKSTPLCKLLPASLIHATMAENIIERNFIISYSRPIHWILIVFMVLLAWLIWRMDRLSFGSLIVLIVYGFISIVIFGLANHTLPIFYPVIAFISTIVSLDFIRIRQNQLQERSLKMMLKNQIEAKETLLNETKFRLAELEQDLQHESMTTRQVQQLAEERKRTIRKLEKELSDLKTYIIEDAEKPHPTFTDIVHTRQSKMAHVLDLVAKVSSSDIPVLITGETGTGKEMIARTIHQTSPRRNAPFIAVNCGALTETLLDSELFGHEKGSFTGALSRRRGRFELANGGTIFLDEITETTPAFQTRLLRILQEGTFERLGSEQTIRVDVRVIAATNKNLQEEMDKIRFRSDLYYRLNGFPLTIPPLRERLEDIPLLAIHFLKKYDPDSAPAFSGRTMEILQSYPWPGNVRELENVVRRAALLAKSEGRNIIKEDDLPAEIALKKIEDMYKPLENQVLEILRSLKFSHSAISQAAKRLGNRDRGTITEYFRGLCFENLVRNDLNVIKAAEAIAGTSDVEITGRVQAKIDEYLSNVKPFIRWNDEKPAPPFLGLPKKYHPYLEQLLNKLKESE